MIKANEVDIDFPEDGLAYCHGEAFTGYSIDHDRDFVGFTSFIDGFQFGLSCEINKKTGFLATFSPLEFGGMYIGGLLEWSECGRLEFETISGFNSSNRVLREWRDDGSLKSDRREKGIAYNKIFEDLSVGFVPWMKNPKPSVGGNVRNYNFDFNVMTSEGEVRWDSLDERFRLRGEAFWGHLLSLTDEGCTRARQVLDGREEGPVWEWSPVGKLVLQGVLHHPYGRVGPWHEWDETGRLVSETIYDALGNRIIDRRLDEVGNIAHEERYEPVRLWRDPETGNERPAPWLWF